MRHTRKSLPIALLRAREAVMAQFRPMLASHDLNEQQWRVLRVLEEQGELDATQLAAHAFILAPSLTRMIKSLQSRKMIARVKDRGDARRSLLRLTQTGLDKIEEVSVHSAEVYSLIDATYGVEKVKKLLLMLDELVTDISLQS